MKKSAPSLRRRLTLAVTCVLGFSLGTSFLILHTTFSRALWREFDARLAQDARTIANMVEERVSGTWVFERGTLDEFERKSNAAYYEVWMDDGMVLARSLSLGTMDLPRPPLVNDIKISDARLPNGRLGRFLLASLPPRQDEEGPPKPSGRRVTVAIAKATDEVDATLVTLRLLILGSGLIALALAGLAGVFAIRGGLAPVARLTERIEAIDEKRLGERLPLEDIPRELQPAVVKLNELLFRLEGSFARERQFSADVSHELRTPIAGLRTMLEVASSRERLAHEYEATILEALHIIEQMNILIENLLMLARLDARQIAIKYEEIDVRELVERAFYPFAKKASERKLQFENLVPARFFIVSDREKFRIVLASILANAVEYTAENGRVTVMGAVSPKEILAVCDSGPSIPEESLERIFDRFFRLDSSRSGTGEHSGIGLALARAMCDVLELSVLAENRLDGSVTFRIYRAGPSI